ncbi:MAG: thioredoxin family protein, partial [Chloroflexi bacterium]|nr:thioredoxin family protein [Chloroflexota bacterium]
LGTGLGMLIVGLALLAAATGFCAGCEMYRIGARLRGIRHRVIDRVELAELGEPQGSGVGGDVVVAFSHPLCTDCRTALDDLAAGSDRWVSVDVRSRPDLARKYGVALVPTLIRVSADGGVLQQAP